MVRNNHLIALNLDIDRRLTGPRARLALVEAILSAGHDEPETHWLEWKSRANLSEKPWRGELASHILGFANRDPTAAARVVGGQAYLAVGVSPGELVGVEAFDPAQLEDFLIPYVGGTEGPLWNPDYVEINERRVLLISVEPPKQGHRIWPLRKTFTDPSGTTHPEGRTFLRRNGQTTPQPTAAEMDMLQRRLLADKAELSLRLEIEEGVPISAIDVTDNARDRWLEWQRDEMLSSLEEVQEEERDEPAVTAFLTVLQRDKRTPDQYRKAVDECLARAKDAFADMVRARAVERSIGLLKLAVVNETQDNLQGLLVELKLEGQVHAFFSEREAAAAASNPERPRPYGEERWASGLTITPPIDGALRDIFEMNSGHISNKNSTWIKFPEIDLRPGYRHALADLYVLADSSTCGSQLSGHWVATSKSVSGSISSVLSIAVADTSIGPDDLRESAANA